jgi:hypothetical protein
LPAIHVLFFLEADLLADALAVTSRSNTGRGITVNHR